MKETTTFPEFGEQDSTVLLSQTNLNFLTMTNFTTMMPRDEARKNLFKGSTATSLNVIGLYISKKGIPALAIGYSKEREGLNAVAAALGFRSTTEVSMLQNLGETLEIAAANLTAAMQRVGVNTPEGLFGKSVGTVLGIPEQVNLSIQVVDALEPRTTSAWTQEPEEMDIDNVPHTLVSEEGAGTPVYRNKSLISWVGAQERPEDFVDQIFVGNKMVPTESLKKDSDAAIPFDQMATATA